MGDRGARNKGSDPVTTLQAPSEQTPSTFPPGNTGAPTGLTSDEARRLLEQVGPNELAERRDNPLLKFLGYFWGPIPWMIEVAAVLSLIVQHWVDFTIILVMLIFNAIVGFWQEFQASNALAALEKSLALNARALRDGQWQQILARELVPGDVIRIRPGDIVPADVKLADGDYLSVDQSALTGESLPVDKQPGDEAYSGSVAKQGEMVALVAATGGNTRFAKTAKLVEKAGAVSHFQKAVLTIGDYLIYVSLGLAAVLVLTQLLRGDSFLSVFQFVLILVIAAIPVAMPAVLSVTMALGAVALSRMKAIVTRLQSIEEIAGIDVLCSDKTGTLTANKLSLGEPIVLEAEDEQDLLLAGALASKTENRDAIDDAVIGGLADRQVLADYEQVRFTPFDAKRKRTDAAVRAADGKTFEVAKGAPAGDLGPLRRRRRNAEARPKRTWTSSPPAVSARSALREDAMAGPGNCSAFFRSTIRPAKTPPPLSKMPASTALRSRWSLAITSPLRARPPASSV